ncbi:hypothetical protein GGR58DRAFT_495756 [Xylaria digitata]|nr:hypothetical protein GGR58DRAFT_495756 [Xylaria digitata]
MEISEPKITHGLRDTLHAFGFALSDLAICGRKSGHNPADDTIRELAVLINLLQLKENSTLQIKTARKKKPDERKKFWYGQAPSPKELYPFTARIYVQGKALRSVVPHWPHLFNIFSSYNPVAVGITGEGHYGWMCFPSLERLDLFIKDVHGKELEREVWNVSSKYDPSIIPMAPEQIRKARQAIQEAERDQNQLERRIKKETNSGQCQGYMSHLPPGE